MVVLLDFYGKKINPLIISRFTYRKGYRSGGHHPYRIKLIKRLPWYKKICLELYKGHWQKAEVVVYGSNGASLFTVTFPSNKIALEFKEEKEKELSDLLAQFSVQCKNHVI